MIFKHGSVENTALKTLENAFQRFQISKFSGGGMPPDTPRNLRHRRSAALTIPASVTKSAGSAPGHHGKNVTTDEELTPTLENVIVITWLRLLHPDLPALIKQRYGTELRSQTLASLKPEISQALESLLEEIQTTNESKVLRTAFQQSRPERNPHPQTPSNSRVQTTKKKIYPLCQQAHRPQFHHYLSKCPFLPPSDRQYLTRARQVMSECVDTEIASDCIAAPPGYTASPESNMGVSSHNYRVTPTTRRVSTKRSPHLKVFYHHHALQLTLDTGAETSMIKALVA